MTASRIALVTGATQGLGRALVEGLAAHMAAHDLVLLTGRDQERVHGAAAAVAADRATARVEGRVLDVRDADAIAEASTPSTPSSASGAKRSTMAAPSRRASAPG
jgi:NAD(P)-dependent dehydrogenase (short-subunit alcohol dehydrogenase family)